MTWVFTDVSHNFEAVGACMLLGEPLLILMAAATDGAKLVACDHLLEAGVSYKDAIRLIDKVTIGTWWARTALLETRHGTLFAADRAPLVGERGWWVPTTQPLAEALREFAEDDALPLDVGWRCLFEYQTQTPHPDGLRCITVELWKP